MGIYLSHLKKYNSRFLSLKTKIILALFTIVILAFCSYELAFSPPITYVDVQRERKDFELPANQSLAIVNHYNSKVQRITIELTSASFFKVNYSIPSDTNFQNLANFTTTHQSFTVDGLRYFIIYSAGSSLKGSYEIDYGPQTSYP